MAFCRWSGARFYRRCEYGSSCLASKVLPFKGRIRRIRNAKAMLYEELRSLNFVENPILESNLLIGLAIAKPKEFVTLNPEYPLRMDEVERINELLALRAREMPMALIRGFQEFWSMEFAVSTKTLIPRPASEVLISEAVKVAIYLSKSKNLLQFADLGTGSGCLAISLYKELDMVQPGRWAGVGVDIDSEALNIARRNAKRLLSSNAHLRFIQSDWTRNMQEKNFDIIISNPPYLTRHDIESLPKSISAYEPRLAFEAGEDGLDAYRRLAVEMPLIMASHGYAVIETGSFQKNLMYGNEEALAVELLVAGIQEKITSNSTHFLHRMRSRRTLDRALSECKRVFRGECAERLFVLGDRNFELGHDEDLMGEFVAESWKEFRDKHFLQRDEELTSEEENIITEYLKHFESERLHRDKEMSLGNESVRGCLRYKQGAEFGGNCEEINSYLDERLICPVCKLDYLVEMATSTDGTTMICSCGVRIDKSKHLSIEQVRARVTQSLWEHGNFCDGTAFFVWNSGNDELGSLSSIILKCDICQCNEIIL